MIDATTSVRVPPIQIRAPQEAQEMRLGVDLQRQIWGYSEIDTVPDQMFIVARESGGQVLFAYDQDQPIGFALAFAAIDEGTIYLHSHMVGVVPGYQNRGVGRLLKLAQREDAIARGIKLIEWTFDPLQLRNAHFNLVRLGAVARRYIPDCYGVTESPLHAGLPTDRLGAGWWIDSVRVKEILAGNLPPANPGGQRISIAANISELKSRDRASGARVQALTRSHFLELFGKEYVATGIENRGDTTDYLLEPRDSVAGGALPALTPD